MVMTNFMVVMVKTSLPYFEIVKLDDLDSNSFSLSSIQPMIFGGAGKLTCVWFNSSSQFNDYLVMPGNSHGNHLILNLNNFNIQNDSTFISTNSLDNVIFAGNGHDRLYNNR